MGKAPDQGKVAIVNSASGVAPTHGGRRPRAYNGGMQKAIDYDELNDALARIGHVDDAAEYHGALCGALCVAKPERIDLMRLIEHDARSEEHTSELQSLMRISYAVFCLKKKKK